MNEMPSSTASLALLGGTPVTTKAFQWNRSIGEEERAAVMRVLDSSELSGFVATAGDQFRGGREVRALEQAFQEHYGVRHALAFNSATTALHAAVSSTGAGPGDEFVVSPYTMSASSTSILMTGAVPIFADIEDETFGLDPDSVEANITPYTKGIMAVNIFGHPARLGPIREIAERHGLFLIEDNAQAPDALYHGRFAGTIGDIGVFSFNRHKVMQSGEGGVLITNNDKLAEKASLMRNHGECVVRDMEIDDIVNTVGLNYRMTEMEAAVASEQFRKMPELNSERIQLAERLASRLREIPGITPPNVDAECKHVYYMFVMKYDAKATGIPRDIFAEAVEAEGFPLRAGYVRPTYLEPVYTRKICFGADGYPFTANPRNRNLHYGEGLCPTCERLQNEEVLLTPIVQRPQTKEDMDRFVDACAKVLANRTALLEFTQNPKNGAA